MPNKMERFTQRARRVLSLAQDEAEMLEHSYIGTEHVLLGLMREEGGVAGRVLRDLGLEQRRVEELVGQMSKATTRDENTQLDLSPGTKRVLELAVDEARRMGHHYIGTEHMLLGLVRQSEGVAIDILKRLGVSPDEVRRQTRRVLQESPVQPTTRSVEIGEAKQPVDKAEEETKALATRIGVGLHSKLLFRVLSALSPSLNSSEKTQMRKLVEKEFSGILNELNFMLSETERNQLLEPLIAPFKPINDGNRHVHVVISDKTNGEIYADVKLPLAQVIEGIEALARAIGEGRTGTLFDINDDDNNHIVISVEDEQDEDAAGSAE